MDQGNPLIESRQPLQAPVDLGEAAVEGLFSGVQAGVLMAGVLVMTGLLRGRSPLAILEAFTPAPMNPSPLTGLLIHLAVSGIYGVIFAAIYYLVPRRFTRFSPGWAFLVFGALYGLFLYLAAVLLILPGRLTSLGQIALPDFALAHLLYGLALGGLFFRQLRRHASQ
jgi:hypothetical protein